MSARVISWAVVGLAVAIAAGANAWQRAQGQLLRDEAAHLQEEQRRVARLREENARLKGSAATAEELRVIATQQGEAERWRSHVAELNRKLRAPAEAAASGAQPLSPLPESNWKYVGRAEPRFALESALWALAGGEVDFLAEQLVFDEPARRRAEELLARLPASVRQNYATPERLIALMTAKDAPQGTARVVSETKRGDEEVALRLRIEKQNGETQSANLVLRRAADGWRFVVPERAVVRYAEMLKGTATGTAP